MTPPQGPKNHILATAEQAKNSRQAAKRQQQQSSQKTKQQGDAFAKIGLNERPKQEKREISQL